MAYLCSDSCKLSFWTECIDSLCMCIKILNPQKLMSSFTVTACKRQRMFPVSAQQWGLHHINIIPTSPQLSLFDWPNATQIFVTMWTEHTNCAPLPESLNSERKKHTRQRSWVAEEPHGCFFLRRGFEVELLSTPLKCTANRLHVYALETPPYRTLNCWLFLFHIHLHKLIGTQMCRCVRSRWNHVPCSRSF